jgi:hypothetical protein
MSVTQHVPEVQISNYSQSFDNRSIDEDAETADTKGSVSQVKIPILTCALNQHRTIGRAVCKVLATDNLCKVELIVVDDCSKNSTAGILAGLPIPSHPASARRTGVRKLPFAPRPHWPRIRICCHQMQTLSTQVPG